MTDRTIRLAASALSIAGVACFIVGETLLFTEFVPAIAAPIGFIVAVVWIAVLLKILGGIWA